MKLSCLLLCVLVGVAMGYRDFSNLKISSTLYQVTQGRAGVWAVTQKDAIYGKDRGNNWRKVGGSLSQIDAGRHVVGVNYHDYIYMRLGVSRSRPLGRSWKRISGKLRHVSSSTSGRIWGTNSAHQIYFRTGTRRRAGGTGWKRISGALTHISAGNVGVWGVNKNRYVYYRRNTYGGRDTAGSGWIHTNGRCLTITAADNCVMCVGTNGALYVRTGITRKRPQGVNWFKMSPKLYDYSTFPALSSTIF